MALTLSEVVIPTFTKGLTTLSYLLTVAQEHAKSNYLDPDAEYPNARLADDILPLTFQVQNVTKTVRKTLARLEVDDLLARVVKTKELLAGVDRGVIDARADRPLGQQTIQGIPNFFFHLQTAYTILRAKGVPIRKRDYIGSFLAQ
ncbi:hypothetical protein C8A00DRAFT_47456 [Chaetomidium leptoderma]|uniref:DUF1993 domain-containing protein n=1 Tax=Chaetomidium leptoderma TaxID=669021 RepID=A0AAN6VC79_9PEZI|nr:hypothetical protein C8A00DRAFT_47456 [Chaetomidium leptoderma]